MSGGDPEREKGFKARKREDHALHLIRELQASLGDLARAKVLLRELGRYYDPVLGGAIVDIPQQRAIVEALQAGRVAEAETMIRTRYELYIRDRAHLGRGEEG
ncbi:MAG TPA: hypothetical protein VJX92_28220 [Methylomirabilota bacterium]|nr:hypothetical protein [Methylomirabilota bacterium]